MHDDPGAKNGLSLEQFLEAGGCETAKSMKVRVAGPAGIRDPGDECRRRQLRQNFLPKGGLTFKAIYRRRVLCDEEGRAAFAECMVHEPSWAQILRYETLGSRMVPFRRPNIPGVWGYDLVPVYFEGWASAEKECQRVAQEIWGERPDFVPDDVVFAWQRRQELTKGLIEKFREGELIGEGVCEYPESSLTLVREVIDTAWWSRNEIEAAFNQNALLRVVRNEPEPLLFYSDIRVLPPEVMETAETDYEDLLLTQQFQNVVFTAAEDLKRKGDKGGRGFPRRIHKRMGSPVKPSVETVRRYLSDRRRGLR